MTVKIVTNITLLINSSDLTLHKVKVMAKVTYQDSKDQNHQAGNNFGSLVGGVYCCTSIATPLCRSISWDCKQYIYHGSWLLI